MNFSGLDEYYLWAATFWGAISGGYLIYGWKKKSWIPFVGGVALSAICFITSAWLMSIAGVVIIFGIHWLLKRD